MTNIFRSYTRQQRDRDFRHRVTPRRVYDRHADLRGRFGHPAHWMTYRRSFPGRTLDNMNFVPRFRQRQHYHSQAGCPIRTRYLDRLLRD